MTIAITPNDVKAFCSTRLPDSAIDTLIGMVQTRIGTCVQDVYAEDEAKMILIYSVCHFVEAAQGGSVTNKKAANGASITIEQYGAGQGLRSTPSGRLLLQVDINGCTNALVAETFIFSTVGDPNPSLYNERTRTIPAARDINR